jgi:hypothetical protein
MGGAAGTIDYSFISKRSDNLTESALGKATISSINYSSVQHQSL